MWISLESTNVCVLKFTDGSPGKFHKHKIDDMTDYDQKQIPTRERERMKRKRKKENMNMNCNIVSEIE